MLLILSPAKTLDYDRPAPIKRSTKPQFLSEASALVDIAREMRPEDIQSMMGVSERIAFLNHRRFQMWNSDFSLDNAKQAIFAFKGDVYAGLRADTFKSQDLAFAQNHLRILSGLYGLLRPLDLMQPYRLEMGLPFQNKVGKNLYEFWGDTITKAIAENLEISGSKVLINLASNEYSKAIKLRNLDAKIITPQFRDFKNGQYKMISFFAKKARGAMARFIIEERLNFAEDLKSFNGNGYYFSPKKSVDDNWVFLRDDAASDQSNFLNGSSDEASRR